MPPDEAEAPTYEELANAVIEQTARTLRAEEALVVAKRDAVPVESWRPKTEIVGYSARGFPFKAGERDAPRPAMDASPAPRKRALRAVRPNAGLQVAYRRKVMALVKEMADSVEYWLRAAYRADPPVMAQDHSGDADELVPKIDMALDATPAAELQAAIRKLSRRWQKRFNEAGPELAKYFALAANKRSDAMLQRILREAGYSVRFRWRMTEQMRDVFRATTEENIGLIRSIPQQYLGQVQGLVMRSVASGRDLNFLTRELKKRYAITEKRAKFIALDQNNKATSAMQRVRQTELGITEGVWMHSHAGKEPRPTHLANDRQKFSVVNGWFDPDKRVRRRIWPGELPICRCVWKPVIKGFD